MIERYLNLLARRGRWQLGHRVVVVHYLPAPFCQLPEVKHVCIALRLAVAVKADIVRLPLVRAAGTAWSRLVDVHAAAAGSMARHEEAVVTHRLRLGADRVNIRIATNKR
ncbi:MAG TPA: hypothetical protein PLV68_01460 [Ilumatobacteraceae bacterium]|nr:hypothetical protein [Ilumatobacteraceae bacterium]